MTERSELVPTECGCPTCGERRMDELEWQPPYFDEKVKCFSCNTEYEPG